MATTVTTKSTSSVVKKATAAADKAAAKSGGPSDAPSLRPNDAKLYGPDMAVMSVACPRCGAKIGKPCAEPAGLRAPHRARVGKSAGNHAKTPVNKREAGAPADHESVAKS